MSSYTTGWFVTNRQRATFLADLASLLDTGLTLKEAMHVLRGLPDTFSQTVATEVEHQLSLGQGLAEGLAPWFTHTSLEIIRAGEHSNSLTQALHAAARTQQFTEQTLSKMLLSLTYPVLVFLLALIMVVVIKNSVLNQFASIKPVNTWPSAGANLYTLALALQQNCLLGLAGLGVMALCAYQLIVHYTGKLRGTLDQWPIIKYYRQAVAVNFLQTIGLMLAQGIHIKQALNILSQQASPYLSWHLTRMQTALTQGHDNIADIFNTALLDDYELHRLKILSTGRHWSKALLHLSEKAQQQNHKNLLRLARLLSGFFLVMTAWLASQIILGIYAIGSTLAIP